MSIAIFVTEETEAATLVPWGLHFCQAKHQSLTIVIPRKSKRQDSTIGELSEPQEDSTSLHKAVHNVLEKSNCDQFVLKHTVATSDEESSLSQILISIKEVVGSNPEEAFIEHLHTLKVQLLLIPMLEPVKGPDSKAGWEQRLFNSAPCGTICLRGAAPENEKKLEVLFASERDEDIDDEYALKHAELLARSSGGSLTLLYVRPSDDIAAVQVAERHLERLRGRVDTKKLTVISKPGLANSLVEGINDLQLDFDLIVIGTRSNRGIRKLLNQLSPGENESQRPLAIVRQGVPFGDKVWDWLRARIRSFVPQITREDRSKLVDHLTSNSNFDFDFIALISLSTLIAALGLVQNSVAVVIGAMLVAPLMSPLVAMGLALVQANERLLWTALKSVFYGFSVALIIGFLVGEFVLITIPGFELSNELRSRGSPNLLDLFVALASGVAAAYAMGRPNLISALPGVAIAAALVPPIATSGVALALGHFVVGGGALFLFLTNIVAIVLGTAITFWSVGISTQNVGKSPDSMRPSRSWPRYWFVGICIVSFVLATFMFIYNPLPGRHKPFLKSFVTSEYGKYTQQLESLLDNNTDPESASNPTDNR